MFCRVFLTLLLALFLTCSFASAQDYSKVEIKTVKLSDSLFVLFGAGGNIAVSVGDDGVFMIDDQFAPLSDKIRAAIKNITDLPVGYVLNTHWHGDHTGGNEHFGKTGAVLVAHENVRKRLSEGQFMEFFKREVPPAPHDALPVITFSRDLTFHLNGETIAVEHVDPAHTDGDSIVYFEQANVIHMGDVYFNRMYPFIDIGSGGSVDGVIKAVELVLQRANETTRIIPGHGPLSDLAELKDYHDMLVAIRDQIRLLKYSAATLDAAIAAKPTAAFDEKLGGGFIKPDKFVEIVYQSIK